MVATARGVEAAREAVAPVVAALGLDLYDVELAGAGRMRTLRVTVDREGGVDLDAIAAVTEEISPVLDAQAPISGPYLLEVSSPGLERPLRRPEHFRGALGETISVRHADPAGPQRTRGRLVEADEQAVCLDAGGEQRRIAYDDITAARTVFEWGPPPRPGRGSKPGKGAARRRSGEKARS